MAKTSRKDNCERGFTLIEILIALVIGSLLGITIFGLFKSQSDAYLQDEQRVEVAQNLRAAMEMITRDVRSAGLYIANLSGVGSIKPFKIGTETLDLEDDKSLTLKTEYDTSRDNNDAVIFTTVDLDNSKKIEIHHGGNNHLSICSPSGMEIDKMIFVMSTEGEFTARKVTDIKNDPSCSSCPCDKISFTPSDDPYNPAGMPKPYANGKFLEILTIAYFIEPDLDGNPDTEDPALMRVVEKSDPAVVAYGINRMEIRYRMDGGTYKLGEASAIPEDDTPLIRGVEIYLQGITRDPLSKGAVPANLSKEMTTEVSIRNLGL